MEEPIKSALSIFDKIRNDSRAYITSETKKFKESFDVDWSYKVKNNIIAFLGDRGSGKTSCMLSFENILKQREKDRDGKEMLFMDVIDPSFFDEHHNILELFVGQLYSLFRKEWETEKRNKEASFELTRDFLNLQRNLSYVDSSKDKIDFEDEASVHLEDLASGVFLQSELRRVVKKTLNYFDCRTLVICIDDLDLNVKRAYEMMEQIRKYLVMPEIIILLSAKEEQLKTLIELSLRDQYMGMSDSMKEKFPIMADRYLTKFLPQSHRVYMVSSDVFLTSELRLFTEDGQLIREFQTGAGGVLFLIFQKTRYLFYNIDGTFSYVIPRNLRNLMMLVEMLNDMPDFNEKVYITTEDTEEAKQNIANKRRFKNYFFGDSTNILEPGDDNDIKRLAENNDPTIFNRRVLDVLSEKFSYILRLYDNPQLEDIYSDKASPFNISVGDVLEVLRYLEPKLSSESDKHYLFFIRAIYSIKLYETYDLYTDSWNQIRSRIDENSNIVQPEKQKWLDDMPSLSDNTFLGIDDYFKLTGGNFFSFSRPRILQDGRDIRLLNGRKINYFIMSLISEYKNWEKKNKEMPEDKKEPLREGFIEELRLMEFFALCSAFHVDVKGTRNLRMMLKEYRNQGAPYYLKRLTGVQNIAFDILKPFESIIYPELSYSNYGKEFYELCSRLIAAEQKSLLEELLLKTRRYGDDNKVSIYADLASRMAIRNMEVLTHLYNYIRDRGRTVKVGYDKRGVPGMYRELLNSVVKNFSVKTYSLGEDNKNYHRITFEPLSVLVSVLGSVIEKPKLRKMFDECFAEVEVENRLPEEGSIEESLLTRGFFYEGDQIRKMIFDAYPDYKREYDLNAKSEFHIRLTSRGGLKKGNGEDVMRYLVGLSDKNHNFENVLNDSLREEYEILLKQKINQDNN